MSHEQGSGLVEVDFVAKRRVGDPPNVYSLSEARSRRNRIRENIIKHSFVYMDVFATQSDSSDGMPADITQVANLSPEDAA